MRSRTLTCGTLIRFPRNLGELLSRFGQVLVPELNMGQLRMLLRAQFLIDAHGLNKVQGKPFTVGEIVRASQGAVALIGRPTIGDNPSGLSRYSSTTRHQKHDDLSTELACLDRRGFCQ